MKRYILAFVPLLLAAVLPAAEGNAATMMPGLKVGDHAAAFTLKNSAGADVSLSDLVKNGPVALVFVRSADWCPFCRRQLQDLQKDLSTLAAAGVQLIALSYDSASTNAAATAKLGLTFPLLSDPGSKVIDAYGIRNTEAKGKAVGVPHPAVFIVDRTGMIHAKLMRDGYRERPESAEIIAAAAGLR